MTLTDIADALEMKMIRNAKRAAIQGNIFDDEHSALAANCSIVARHLRELAASGIEARSDETRSGSAEGKSPVPKADAQGQQS